MNYERIVELIREIAPPLSLKSTKYDLTEAIRNIGINVKYSDMSHLPKNEGFVYGFVRTTQTDVDIILNSTIPREQSRYIKAQLLGYTFLYLKWLPIKPIEADQLYIISSENHDYETKQNLKEFAKEFLAPKKEVKKDYDLLIGPLSAKIKYLSNKYKVSDGLISVQLFTKKGIKNNEKWFIRHLI